MAKPIPNEFQQYAWESESEERLANFFPEAQLYLIKNKLALALLERSTLTYDVTNPHSFIQQEAALMGEISAYRQIVDNHNELVFALNSNPAQQE